MATTLDLRTSAAAAHRRKRLTSIFSAAASYLWVGSICLTTLFPFFWMISSSFKPRAEIVFFRLLPVSPTLNNYVRVLTKYPYFNWYLNTFIYTLLTVGSVLLFSAMAAYALSKFRFRGREFFFVMILATIMVPSEMLIIPWYVSAQRLGLGNSLAGLLFPGLISAFGVFVLRQAMFNVPNELIDAARVDGMSEPGIFVKIILPLVSGALAALAILTALSAWNDYLWPLIIMRDAIKFTLQVGISYAALTDAAEAINDWTVIMSSTTIASLPMLILMIATQRYLVKGITLTGLKG
jgi:multiple sugar transport system permease protein